MPPPKGEDLSNLKLPGIIDGVLGFFEGVAGKPRVSFHFHDVQQKHPCGFCGMPTSQRLMVTREGEQANSCICEDCKGGIKDAITA